jgi:stage II sporulation protein D
MLALRAGGGGALRLVLALPLERYVASVLVSEAADAPGEALAAQAVVTRSWALAHRGRHGDADACDLTHCQLYRGEQAPHADAAAARTAGQVLREGGSPVPAFFHAACGGHTAGARAVFGERGPAPVPDLAPDGRPWCEGPPWTFDVERRALAAVLGLRPEGPVRVLGRTGDGRVRAVEAFGRVVPGPRFVAVVTRALGYGTLRSARFQVQEAGERLRFSGEGRGHGVGFCQAGAAARARAGQGYRALLRAYFPGAEVTAPTRGISPAP